MDDVILGASDEDSAYELYTNSKSVLKQASFNLHKFTTNSNGLQERIDKADGEMVAESNNYGLWIWKRRMQSTHLEQHSMQPQRGEQKILGVRRDAYSDQIFFSRRSHTKQKKWSENTTL